MSLKEQINSGYVDFYGLVSPRLCTTLERASDNGPLFTAEYLVLQALNNEPLDEHAEAAMLTCIDPKGYLHRAPDDPSEDAPDDYYGVLSYLALMDIKGVKFRLPLKCLHPTLIYLWIITRSIPIRALFLPIEAVLTVVIPIVMALSNLGEEPSNTSNKLLSWITVEAIGSRSILGAIARFVWYTRMKRIYGTEPMGTISSIYFPEGHPFNNYMKLLGKK